MIPPYDHAALWRKAKVFLNRAMDPQPIRSFDERALWAAAALELLGKAALSKVSPVLIADPESDGQNLLVATGLLDTGNRFMSIQAKAVFSRCGKAFRPFNGAEAMKIAANRNEYLHGAGTAFMALPPDVWWSRYWALATILVDAYGQDIEALVGLSRLGDVESYLERNTKYVQDRTESLIEHARRQLALFQSGRLTGPAEREWRARTQLGMGLSYSVAQQCPACGAEGNLEGEDVLETRDYDYDYQPDGDSWLRSATLQVGPDYFSCPTCHLVLPSYDLVAQAGLPDPFEVVDYDPPPPEEYGND